MGSYTFRIKVTCFSVFLSWSLVSIPKAMEEEKDIFISDGFIAPEKINQNESYDSEGNTNFYPSDNTKEIFESSNIQVSSDSQYQSKLIKQDENMIIFSLGKLGKQDTDKTSRTNSLLEVGQGPKEKSVEQGSKILDTSSSPLKVEIKPRPNDQEILKNQTSVRDPQERRVETPPGMTDPSKELKGLGTTGITMLQTAPIEPKEQLQETEKTDNKISPVTSTLCMYGMSGSHFFDSLIRDSLMLNIVRDYQPMRGLLVGGSHSKNKSIFTDDQYFKEMEGKLITDIIDRRKEVIDPTIVPWHAHGALEITFPKAPSTRGSGILVGQRLVLTCAHNLYNRETKETADNITFFPGRKEKAIYAIGNGKMIFYHPNWVKLDDSQSQNFDIGLIFLEKEFAEKNFKKGEERLSFFACGYVNQNKLKSQEVTITGYPAGALINKYVTNLDGKRMMTMKGPINRFKENKLYYNIDTTQGQSGSGIWLKVPEKNKYICCGVHTNTGETQEEGNFGVFINEEILGILKLMFNQAQEYEKEEK